MSSQLKKQKRKAPQNHINRLGIAPNDIYEFEQEYKKIEKSTECDNIDNKKTVKGHEMKHILSKDIIIECDNINDAKKALKEGHEIKYILSKDITPLELIHITKSLKLYTKKLEKVLSSSMVFKKLIDNYVENLKSSDDDSTGSYLKHCTQVIPLKCNDEMMPQFKIKMDLDYKQYVAQDDEFETKFVNELSSNVFKCEKDKIKLVEVRQGSIMVIVVGCVIALAFGGIVGLSICLCHSKNGKNEVLTATNNGEMQEFHLDEKVLVIRNKKTYSGMIVGLLSGDKVRVRYDGSGWNRPSWCTSEEEFATNDQSLNPLEPGADPDINGSLVITETQGFIKAKNKMKKKAYDM